MTVDQQLQLDLPDVTADPFDDLEFDGHEARLEQLDRERAAASHADLAVPAGFVPPPVPVCRCAPHGLHATDEDGTAVCWACGRQVAPATDLKPSLRVAHGGTTPVLPAQSGDGLRPDPRETGR